jgi:prepilin-type N-terminal cleavage/methylation domain-containing protein
MSRRGFTIIEMLTVVAIIGILVNIAVPATLEVRRRAEAAQVIGDYSVIRTAAYDRFAQVGSYPSNGSWGAVPAALVSSLPRGFAFRRGSLTYRWRRWSLPNGLPGNARPAVLLGLEVRTTDAKLMKAIRSAYRGRTAYGSTSTITLVIE